MLSDISLITRPPRVSVEQRDKTESWDRFSRSGEELLVGSFGSTVLPLSRRANFRNAEVRETLAGVEGEIVTLTADLERARF